MSILRLGLQLSRFWLSSVEQSFPSILLQRQETLNDMLHRQATSALGLDPGTVYGLSEVSVTYNCPINEAPQLRVAMIQTPTSPQGKEAMTGTRWGVYLFYSFTLHSFLPDKLLGGTRHREVELGPQMSHGPSLILLLVCIIVQLSGSHCTGQKTGLGSRPTDCLGCFYKFLYA